MSDQANRNDDDEPSILDHNYDGIQEYDNPTPDWWTGLFILSVVFAPIYVIWFHSPWAERTQADRYETAWALHLKRQFGELGELTADGDTVLRFIDDEKWLQVGRATFATNCASCHGKGAEGISAPNLTDDHYLHVKQIGDIAKVLQNGANNGAMPAWESRLHPTELVLVASYVASLRGGNASSNRPAEGKVIEPWPTKSTAEQ